MEYILLTGSTSSIGKSIAVSLSNKYAIVLAGQNALELKEIQSSLEGEGHLIWLCDFLKDDISESLNSFLNLNKVNPCHFLHLSGLFSVHSIRLQKTEETLKTFQINVFSAIEIMTVLSRKQFKSTLRNVLFFSSISYLKGKPGYSVYAAAKSALIGLMRSLAVELKPIKINAVVLGAVKTKATQFIINDNEEFLNKSIPLGLAEEDVLNHWMHFLLEGKTWMTGQEIIIDGGATIL
jgi:NAD(P)-dependent dehydrogenase (short-subunit alcohol dehydrogenase family)